MFRNASQVGKIDLSQKLEPVIVKKEIQEIIDDYLLCRISDAEWQAFEKEAAHCDSEIQEQLSFTKDVQRITKSKNEKLARLKEWRADYQGDVKGEK